MGVSILLRLFISNDKVFFTVLLLGELNNTKSRIIRGGNGTYSSFTNHKLLHCNMIRDFWISWGDGSLHVGTGLVLGQGEFLTNNDSEHIPINYLAVSTGVGASGLWIFYTCK